MTKAPFSFRNGQQLDRGDSDQDDQFDWRQAFSRLRFAHPEDALREIAAHLYRHGRGHGDGRVDPSILFALAQMLDPDEATPAAGVKLELRRPGKRKSPPKEPNYALRTWLDTHLDAEGNLPRGMAEGLYREAKDRFGVSRSQCDRQLAVMREFRKRMADMNRFLAQVRP